MVLFLVAIIRLHFFIIISFAVDNTAGSLCGTAGISKMKSNAIYRLWTRYLSPLERYLLPLNTLFIASGTLFIAAVTPN